MSNNIQAFCVMKSSQSTFEVYNIIEKKEDGNYTSYLVSSKCNISGSLEKIHTRLKMFGAYQNGKDIGVKTKYIDEEMYKGLIS